MKKIAIVLAVLMMLSVVPFVSNASATQIIENDPVIMSKAEPVIDGTISAGEGWSAKALLNDDTAGYFWAHQAMSTSADLYFAYSDDGIYFAGDITERNHISHINQNGDMTNYDGNSFIYSTGEDDIDIGADNLSPYGWNGDIFTLMIDPQDALFNAGFTANTDYSPWYNVGLFRDGDSDVARVYRTKVNYGEITSADGVSAAGKVTENGWMVEVFIPWDIIIQDISDLSFGEVNLVKSDVIADGAEITAAIMYMDRFYDDEAGVNDTWGRYITVCETCEDGTPGQMSSGDPIKSMGLSLVAGNAPVNPFIDIPNGKWYTAPVLYCFENGYMSGTTANTFEPGTIMNRAMFATLLYKIDGADETYDTMSFADVNPGQWYSNAIEWAYQHEYASGVGTDDVTGKPIYGRKNDVSREQLALFIYNYSAKKGYDVTVADDFGYSVFTDTDRVHDWAVTAMKWAVQSGLIPGTSATTLSPRVSATRAQVATIIMKYVTAIIPV